MRRYLLDTNVISDARKPQPSPAVAAWFEATDIRVMFISAVTHGELLFGALRLEAGRKRDDLLHWIHATLSPQFEERILAFDRKVSEVWAELTADARRRGRPRNPIDLQIAATAIHHGLTLVTRDTGDFADTGVPLVDPWQHK